jgi:hypothetical protein
MNNQFPIAAALAMIAADSDVLEPKGHMYCPNPHKDNKTKKRRAKNKAARKARNKSRKQK